MATLQPQTLEPPTGTPIILRHCALADIDAFLDFQPQIAAETTHTLQRVGNVPKADNVRAAWQASIDHPIELRIGAFDRERMVGQVSLHPLQNPPHPWNRHIATFGMMVLREYWGRGIGRSLLERMEAHARKVGITRIEALVRVSNERGVKLYQRAGYEIEGTRRGAALIHGVLHDEYFIAKRF